MNIAELTLQVKDVILIAGGIITLAGIYFPLQSSTKLLSRELSDHKDGYRSNILGLRSEIETKLSQSTNDIKSDINSIYEDINKNKMEAISMIKEVKRETKEEYSKLSTQINSMNIQVTNFGSEIARLNGYLKAQNENNNNKNH